MATANGPCRMLIKSVCPLFARKRTSLGRTFTMSDEDFVDIQNSKLLWHWCEPWGGVQSGPRVGELLLPSRLHGRAAKLEVLQRALGLGRTINELHNIHLGHTTVLVESLSLIGARDFRRQ